MLHILWILRLSPPLNRDCFNAQWCEAVIAFCSVNSISLRFNCLWRLTVSKCLANMKTPSLDVTFHSRIQKLFESKNVFRFEGKKKEVSRLIKYWLKVIKCLQSLMVEDLKHKAILQLSTGSFILVKTSRILKTLTLEPWWHRKHFLTHLLRLRSRIT